MVTRIVFTLLILAFVNNQLTDAKSNEAVLKNAIEKFKLFASKMRSMKSKLSSAASDKCTASAPNGKLTELADKPIYKRCAVDCILGTSSESAKNAKIKSQKLTTLPADFEPVFEADLRKELINCKLKPKVLTRECAKIRAHNLASLSKMGPNKVLFAPSKKLSWFGANKYCRSRGLALGSLETDYKINQFSLYLNSLIAKGSVSFSEKEPLNVWTSGSSTSAPGKKYYWQELGKLLASEVSSSFKFSDKKNCVQASMVSGDNLKWKEENCNANSLFFCEFPKLCYMEKCKTGTPIKSQGLKIRAMASCVPKPCPTCPPDGKKSKSSENGESSGKYFGANNKKYFYGESRRTFDDAFNHCCKLKMMLWSMKSPEEENAIIDGLFSIGFGETWRGAYVYINAKDENCDENFVWCEKGGKKRPVGAEYSWSPFAPNDFLGIENCLIFAFEKNSYRLMDDFPCVLKLNYICESLENSSYQNAVEQFAPPLRKFETNQDCREKSKCKPNNVLAPDENEGTILKACGKTYFFSKEAKTYWSASSHCCKMGMHLATISSIEESNCVASYFSNRTLTQMRMDRMMYISTIYAKENTHYWCASDQKIVGGLESLPWVEYEPDNAFPPESGMAFLYGYSAYGVGDCNAMLSWNYICQSPQSP